MKKDLNYYLSLPYTMLFEWNDEDNCFLGSILELERNMTCGDTIEEVLSNLKEALEAYVITSLENDLDIPEPIRLSNFKGKIAYRTTKERHYELAKASKLKGISINAFIDDAVERRLAEMI